MSITAMHKEGIKTANTLTKTQYILQGLHYALAPSDHIIDTTIVSKLTFMALPFVLMPWTLGLQGVLGRKFLILCIITPFDRKQ